MFTQPAKSTSKHKTKPVTINIQNTNAVNEEEDA